MRILKSRKFWVGALAGTVAGGWALRKLGISIPKA